MKGSEAIKIIKQKIKEGYNDKEIVQILRKEEKIKRGCAEKKRISLIHHY